MTLSPDRIQYLELRATTDCLLGVLRDGILEFFGADAEKVAQVCELPLTYRGQDVKGSPIAVCGFPATLESDVDGIWRRWRLIFDARWRDAIWGAGYPFAVACDGDLDDCGPELRIRAFFRPLPQRPSLRVV